MARASRGPVLYRFVNSRADKWFASRIIRVMDLLRVRRNSRGSMLSGVMGVHRRGAAGMLLLLLFATGGGAAPTHLGDGDNVAARLRDACEFRFRLVGGRNEQDVVRVAKMDVGLEGAI